MADPVGGEPRWRIELLGGSLPEVRGMCERYLDGVPLDSLFPTFDRDAGVARARAERVEARRGAMPVIDEADKVDLMNFLQDAGMGVMCDACHASADELMPTQCQIYLDRCIDARLRYGVLEGVRHLMSTHLLIDVHDNIIDGHHRWMSAMLTIRDVPLPAWRLRRPVDEVMDALLKFSDARRARNA